MKTFATVAPPELTSKIRQKSQSRKEPRPMAKKMKYRAFIYQTQKKNEKLLVSYNIL